MSSSVPAGNFFNYHHLEFWVGNAFQAASFYITRFGFHKLAYKGLETQSRDKVTHVIKQGNIIFSFTSPLNPENEQFNREHATHGDGVKDVAFSVDNAEAIFDAAVENGAEAVAKPETYSDENGSVIMASIRTYGDTIHTFVQNVDYKGPFLPGYKAVEDNDPMTTITDPINLELIDHCVGNQDWNQMTPVEEWYKQKLGWERFWSVDDDQIHTEFSALRSVVVTDKQRNIVMPINEPAKGKKKSQIEEFVEYYKGSGVQHIALRTENIIESIKLLRRRGVVFLKVPDTYYEDLRKRLSKSSVKVEEDIDTLQELGILVDFDENGYLLQLFSKPVEDRPTLFIEIIQRRNNDGFGVGNFKALFEAIEREQKLRGNL
eukprot:gb/GECH01011241.1/.p1 GENE.gb/GECH01011241.1/~~gb/GECH01011241.1/.p1  ORF type:complete len:376 (+),score=82.04 gb/GECH01011241.1/:1-1128(+)